MVWVNRVKWVNEQNGPIRQIGEIRILEAVEVRRASFELLKDL